MGIAGVPIILTLEYQLLKSRPVLDSQAQTTRGKVLDFFVKPQNKYVTLVFEKRCFPGFFRNKIDPLSSNRVFSKSKAYYERM